MIVPFEKIPSIDCATGVWSYTDFESQAAFGKYFDTLWSDECNYEFDEDSVISMNKARFFKQHGYYTAEPRKSPQRKQYWTQGRGKVRTRCNYQGTQKGLVPAPRILLHAQLWPYCQQREGGFRFLYGCPGYPVPFGAV
jgi:hypothetical protein